MSLVVTIADPALGRPRRSVRLRAVGGALLAAAVGLVSSWPLLVSSPVIGLVNVLVAVSFTATGIVLLEERQQRGTGVALILVAVFYLWSWGWSWPPQWQVFPLPLIASVCGYLWFVFGVYALLRYPDPQLTRWWDRVYVAVLGLWVVVPKLVLAVVAEREWIGRGYDQTTWWPTLWPNRPLYDALSTVSTVGLVVVAVPVLVPLLLKVRRSRSVDRIDAVPGVIAAVAVLICGSAYLLAWSGSLPSATIDTLRAVIGVSALFTPIAFLTSALRRGLTRAALADLVVRLVRSPSGPDIQAELRQSLRDDTLVLLFWLPREQVYVDVDDVERGAQPPADGRWPVQIRSTSGDALALMLLDPALQRHPGLVAPAVAACGFALENYRLHADLKGRLREVQQSRARLAEAELRGRQQIERDLHDGAQQTLLVAAASLGEARQKAEPGSDVYAAIERARSDLRAATGELRGLARGIHPPVLTQSGLRAALEGVIERMGLPTSSAILDQRLPPAVEATAYFLVCEALTNAARHAGAHRVRVDVQRDDDRLHVSVVDDGTGGARIATGSGLANIRDRVEAIGGRMRLDSPAGGGTTLAAELPCG
ncbi:sensor histidine kinase [Pseudonocardia humida]|uniref:histidine kinase n=1 Tax=Pseudonocardia humida TaxID=2800819 RepID=A0ABT1A8H4_9PSEU|nr:sensor histidine kinase [Pseudonocardia humida]MCO1659341.1 sensor histidine kinase [Pseudonocardia humida]